MWVILIMNSQWKAPDLNFYCEKNFHPRLFGKHAIITCWLVNWWNITKYIYSSTVQFLGTLLEYFKVTLYFYLTPIERTIVLFNSIYLTFICFTSYFPDSDYHQIEYHILLQRHGHQIVMYINLSIIII